jgi:hypothetical protein
MQLRCLPQRTLDRHGHRVWWAFSGRDNRPLLDIRMMSAIYCGAQLALLPGCVFPRSAQPLRWQVGVLWRRGVVKMGQQGLGAADFQRWP